MPEIEVNCNVLSRIQRLDFDGDSDDPEYLLFLNGLCYFVRNMAIYTPPGGGMQVTRDGERALSRYLGVKVQDRITKPYKSNATGTKELDVRDLTLELPVELIPGLLEWLDLRDGRELNPIREVMEELTEEYPWLVGAHELQAQAISSTYVGRHVEMLADKVRISEVYDVALSPAVIRSLGRHSKLPWTTWVTPQDIQRGRAEDGIKIGQVSHSLVAANNVQAHHLLQTV